MQGDYVMKTILVIGIGRFGQHLTKKFVELNNEVMVVDKEEEKIQDLMDVATYSQIGDCTKEEVLASLGINNFDLCFVCIGGDFQSSLVITALLKDMGAKYVVSKATLDIHAKFLLRNGADEVVYPEKDMAHKIATKYSTNKLFDYMELSKEVSIYEIPTLDTWVGKSIRETNFRVKYNVSILATKTNGVVNPLPSADYVFKANQHLIVIGRHADIEKILR